MKQDFTKNAPMLGPSGKWQRKTQSPLQVARAYLHAEDVEEENGRDGEVREALN